MLIDSHVHVGQFNNLYFAPSTVHELMEQIGVSYYAVSSTTQCEENYIKVLDELHELINLDGDKVLPIMWVTPEGLDGNIAWYLDSNIKWRMLKIHPFLNKTAWLSSGSLITEVIDIARELDLPLLIHTGNEYCCRASQFEPAIRDNSDINFVLAHGRPAVEAIRLVRNYANAYVDSAFMSIEEIKQFVHNKLTGRMLWGTDMCIPKYFFPQEEIIGYYRRKLNAFRSICTQEQFELVTYRNAVELLKL